MHSAFVSSRQLLMGPALRFGATKCGSKLNWRSIGQIDGQSSSGGAMWIDATAGDEAELERDRPFRWRGCEVTGFMLLDAKITDTGAKDLLWRMGRLDSPGVVLPELSYGNTK